jgi:hypothetical protein
MRYLMFLFCFLWVTPCFAEDFLAGLKKDQKIGLKEVGTKYTITVWKDNENLLPWKIIEIGKNYIVVEDFVGVNTIRIPALSIKAVKTITLPKMEDEE